ncbi:MAG: tRNA 2-selenouridine(34) synthase MnmH [Chitinophagaceae bacterium]|nr:tRNA 2-selenouridine(34) synthase MnmH [Chitinophagaceae bacterium]
MITSLSLSDFLTQATNSLVIDVRTPAEFEQGRIFDAVNIPLFTNEERVLVGTAYKQQGRQPAILLGFELIGARWAQYIRDIENLLKEKSLPPTTKILVHCWRGGMRSAAMAWALQMYGFKVATLQGGYKTYRKFCVAQFDTNYKFLVLGGKTGSAKTSTLLEMKSLGEQVIDLEGLACHQGSSFGSKGIDNQPSQEQFENLVAHELSHMDKNKWIWLENESITIGRRAIPLPIFKQMRLAQVIDMQVPLEARVDFLFEDYGHLDPAFLKQSVINITKRLGPLQTKMILQAIDENRLKDFIRQTLVYYDKTYSQGKTARIADTVHSLELDSTDSTSNALAVIEFSKVIQDKIDS